MMRATRVSGQVSLSTIAKLLNKMVYGEETGEVFTIKGGTRADIQTLADEGILIEEVS